MSNYKILITGGCGFIGSHLVHALAPTPYQIYVLDNLSTGSVEAVPLDRVELANYDIQGEEAAAYIKKVAPDYVIHLAAQVDVQSSLQSPQKDADINILGTLNVAIACAEVLNLKQLVFASTAAVYGDDQSLPLTENSTTLPMSPYGQSKLVCEQYLALFHKLYQLPYVVLRFANVYGKKRILGTDAVSKFIHILQQGDSPVVYGDGNQTRDFIYVLDIVQALIASLKITQSDCYNVSTNEQTTINTLLSYLSHSIGTQQLACFLPERLGDIKDSRLDNKAFCRATNWKPKYSLELGVNHLYNTYTQ
ncbi:NAD-dependent epimerase/dehydratase family protein [Carnobacterium maltaromaticum]|uniref:NAD-dependent epimerase/dehydratase family protein n=1 Tax=Carnobacterium maltaromaticum TaxID=2751 RepID=UPI00191B9D9E|nr:NAD-dependent epimerase/dehydratase family protein [Carnobacterium maltaromaticum]CAD5902915.1 conserved hypothetical protein [Carnobacterium maltaromaticum]